jgi:hypothetical protein
VPRCLVTSGIDAWLQIKSQHCIHGGMEKEGRKEKEKLDDYQKINMILSETGAVVTIYVFVYDVVSV